MHNQPKFKPLAESDFFGDGRSARPVIEGTVARGHLRLDSARFTGKVNNADVDSFPFTITRADLARGQERFNIFCSPCHGRLGDGQGMIVRRGFKGPPSYFSDRVLKAPLGHYFDVVTNGFGAMASYASRVPVDDRWRIIAYIKTLQYSRNAAVADVPEDHRADLDRTPQQQLEQRESGGETPANRPPVPAPARRGFDAPHTKGTE
jgi:mono/diheme cytochrome c family protein